MTVPGLTTLTRILLSFRSTDHIRANDARQLACGVEAEGRRALIEVIDALITIDAQDEDYRRMLFIRVNRNAGHKIANGKEYHEICTIVGHRHDHHGEL